jgi:hypothetical protein
MKLIATLIAGTALALSGSAALAKAPSGEERLVHMLEGRTAGQPASCISDMRSSKDVQVLDRVGLVFKAGDTIWVARASDPDSIRESDILVVDRWSSGQLCRHDPMRMVDHFDGSLRSIVFLDEFVPYRRS